MNGAEAKSILTGHLERYQKWSYPELHQLMDRHDAFQVNGPSGASYSFELYVQWEGEPDGPVLVVGSINDSNAPASGSLRESFVIRSGAGSDQA